MISVLAKGSLLLVQNLETSWVTTQQSPYWPSESAPFVHRLIDDVTVESPYVQLAPKQFYVVAELPV